ncbi:MAG: GAF domain-containing protein [Anaerolineales bacterium]|uniref:GAF domain-containing protein n=1 Tax=Candidatus Villigracilis proximus TaxID=3140683 RepID=UPI0031369C7B|nr:GAF domain-containing protein [Anaerolineales bacterium]
MLSKILDGAIVLTRATHGTIGLVVDLAEGPVIRTVATYNMPDGELGAEMASGVGLAGCVLKEDRTIRLDRYGDLDYPTLPELAEHSVLGVPIRWGEKMIGFFGIGAAASHHFNEWDAETLELLASMRQSPFTTQIYLRQANRRWGNFVYYMPQVSVSVWLATWMK